MRVVIFSLIDDWEIGPLLAEKGHELLAWFRPAWDTESDASLLTPGLRRAIKRLLALDRPLCHVIPKFDVREWLKKTGTPRIACDDVNDPAFVDSLRRMRIDVAVVAIYPQMFGAALLEAPRFGVINYHPSLLPRYAGPQPAFWVLRNGEKETGITIHRMTEQIDAGDLLAQEVVGVRDDENIGQLMQRLHHRSAPLIIETLEAIGSGSVNPRPQSGLERTYFGRRKAVDTRINWNEHPLTLMNLLRAVQPFEPLKAGLRGRIIKIFEARPASAAKYGHPGEILEKRGGHLVVQAGERFLEITNYEVAPFHGWMNRLAQEFVPLIGDRFDISSESSGTEA